MAQRNIVDELVESVGKGNLMPSATDGSWCLEVDKRNLDLARMKRDAEGALQDGQVLIRAERIAMTANTMTYAALGDSLGYWQLFPAESDWGRIPAWGHGRVVTSRSTECEVGTLLFGLFPMASSVVLTVRRSRLGFKATDPHRMKLNPVYNQYSPIADAPERELASKVVFHPLVILSFVLQHHLKEASWFNADEVVVISASSKTALAFAFLARSEVSCTGLTSSKQKDWLKMTGVYAKVCDYALGASAILGRRILVVDFSGNTAVVGPILRELGERVAWLVKVGYTHVTESAVPGAAGESARAEVFFGSHHIEKLVRAWGGAEFNERFETALTSFFAASDAWFNITYVDGEANFISAYRRLRRGELSASEIMVSRPRNKVEDGMGGPDKTEVPED